jgi:hypothetical protein
MTSLVPSSSSFHLTAWGQAAYASAITSAVGTPQPAAAFV